jgi:hypothetical protein
MISRANRIWLLAVYLHCTSVFATVCYHHHHLGIVESGHLLILSGLTHPEVSSVVSPGFFCPLVCSFLLFCVKCYEAFCWHVAPSSVYCPKVGLHIIPCNLCICFIICPNVSCCSSRIFYDSSMLVFAVNEHYHYHKTLKLILKTFVLHRSWILGVGLHMRNILVYSVSVTDTCLVLGQSLLYIFNLSVNSFAHFISTMRLSRLKVSLCRSWLRECS